MRTAVIQGKRIDLDAFVKAIQDYGERLKARNPDLGQRIVDRAEKIAAWYIAHQCYMKDDALETILTEADKNE